jgi:hypothetical protein
MHPLDRPAGDPSLLPQKHRFTVKTLKFHWQDLMLSCEAAFVKGTFSSAIRKLFEVGLPGILCISGLILSVLCVSQQADPVVAVASVISTRFSYICQPADASVRTTDSLLRRQ